MQVPFDVFKGGSGLKSLFSKEDFPTEVRPTKTTFVLPSTFFGKGNDS